MPRSFAISSITHCPTKISWAVTEYSYVGNWSLEENREQNNMNPASDKSHVNTYHTLLPNTLESPESGAEYGMGQLWHWNPKPHLTFPQGDLGSKDTEIKTMQYQTKELG